jgi:hypothetical protein
MKSEHEEQIHGDGSQQRNPLAPLLVLYSTDARDQPFRLRDSPGEKKHLGELGIEGGSLRK